MANTKNLLVTLTLISIFSATFFQVNSVSSPSPAPASDCATMIMGACLSFVRMGSELMAPQGTCCSDFKSRWGTSADIECLCAVSKSADYLGINITKLMSLPPACDAPSRFHCGIKFEVIKFLNSPMTIDWSPVQSPVYNPNYSPPFQSPDYNSDYSPPAPVKFEVIKFLNSPMTIDSSPVQSPVYNPNYSPPVESPVYNSNYSPPFQSPDHNSDYSPPAPGPSTYEQTEPEAPSVDTLNSGPTGHHKVVLIVGLVGGVLSFLAIPVFYYLWRRNKHRRREVGYDVEMNKDFEHDIGPKRFSYKEILQATNSFSEKNKLGEGGFGGVYKGFLKDLETHIAVKRVSKTSEQGIREYTAEVKIISRLRHKNLVELKGWCHEKSELLLIYEFMENSSLDLHLFKKKSLLTWDKRKRIAYGLASALTYLHEDCKECILHRDIKSSNVMLDSNFDAKLGDFGLAKLVDHEKGAHTTMLAGTLGYMAPEYVVTGKASKESDVFSFGVVALEIACGRKSIENKAPEKQVKLVEWVWDLYGTGSFLEAVDLSLRLENTEELERLLIVGLWCAHPHANLRPSMRQANQVLNSEASLPILPPKMPKINFHSPPTLSELGDYSSGTTGSSTLSSKVTTSSTTSSPAALLFS